MATDVMDILDEARMTIDQCKNAENKDLFVINTCDMNGLYDKGDVILNVSVSGEVGKKARIAVPDTWIPWELSHYAEKERWLRDVDFVKAVRKGTITIIDSDTAREILTSSEGQQEYNTCISRTVELEQGHARQTEVMESRLNTAENRDKVKQAVDANKTNGSIPTKRASEVVASASDAPQVKVISILNNKSLDENAKISALRNIQRTLKPHDLKWIVRHSPKEYTKLKEWVVGISK